MGSVASLVSGTMARHILTALGTVLVNKGLIDSTALDLATGAIVTLFAVGWSVVQKLTAKQAVQGG